MSDETTDDGMADEGSAGEAPIIDHATALMAVRDGFADLAAQGEVDILPNEGDDRTDIAVAGDAWTVYLTGWPGPQIAFLAIEDEPEDEAAPAAVDAAWRGAVPDGVLPALLIIDNDLGGALTDALRASTDPLSISLAAAVRPAPLT